MRMAAVGDGHGDEHREMLASDLDRLGPVDLFLLAGDLTDRNDREAYGRVLETVRSRTGAPMYAVFGNNEYEDAVPEYVERFSDRYGVRFLRDEAVSFETQGGSGRIVGSTGSLDRPTWWQRKNLPHMADTYRRRITLLDTLLAGTDLRILLTHYPPTYVTMGDEKDAWRPELGCQALEPVLLRRRPNLVIHGHIHKGIPEADLGVVDTGDMVSQQAGPNRADVVTYLEGRASGYATYGDYGDVIIFRHASDPTPVIHRAIMYVTLHNNGTYATADVDRLSQLTGWEATTDSGPIACPPTCSGLYLRTLTIHRMGFRQNLGITFDFANSFLLFAPRSGYITMGDYNAAFISCATPPFDPCAGTPYDRQWLPVQGDIIGRARGEFPWFGLLKLTLQPTITCCSGWGDPEAPKNSWDSLVVSLVVLFAFPFILEYAARGWKKYVSPRLPEIRWPWRGAKTKPERRRPPEDADESSENPRRGRRKPPNEESSEP